MGTNNFNTAALNFASDLQRFNQLELNSASAFENSEAHDSPGKHSLIQRSKSRRIAKTKTKLQPPTKKLDYDDK